MTGVVLLFVTSFMFSHSAVISQDQDKHQEHNSNHRQHPDTGQNEISPTEALSYLGHYGYFSISSSSKNFSLFDSFSDSLRNFQQFFGLAPSGILDRETSEVMKKPRCGVPDLGDIQSQSSSPVQVDLQSPSGSRHRRVKRFSVFDSSFLRDIMDILGGSDGVGMSMGNWSPLYSPTSRWRSLDLTYRVSKYPESTKLTRKQVDKEIKEAFNLWSNVTDLSFTDRSYGPVHIDIRFEKRDHGDREPFDGVGGVLAHTYYPLHGGDVHFDNDEDWVVQPRFWTGGTHLRLVAAHELGHALGLPHSSDSSALMFPTIDDHQVYDVKLARADIKAIQRLYGPRTKKSTLTTSSSASKPEKNKSTTEKTFKLWEHFLPEKDKTESEKPKTQTSVCEGRQTLKLFNVDSSVYLVLLDKTVPDHKVWMLDESGKINYSSPIGTVKSMWPGLSRTPDAGFTWTNGLTYFFIGSKYYRYTNRTLDEGFPRRMKHGFSGIPIYLDAAVLSPNQTQIFFVKNSRFWTFSPQDIPPLQGSEKLSDGISDVVSAIQFNNKMYIFSKDKYWRLDRPFSVDKSVSPAYPRQTREWWFGCK